MIYYIIYFVMCLITYFLLSINIDSSDPSEPSGAVLALISLFSPILLPVFLIFVIGVGLDNLSKKNI